MKTTTKTKLLRALPGGSGRRFIADARCLCSDKVEASYEVLKDRAEDALVEAGEKVKWRFKCIAIMPLKSKSEFDMVAYENNAWKLDNLQARIAETQDPDSIAQLESLAAVYELAIPKLQEGQEKGAEGAGNPSSKR